MTGRVPQSQVVVLVVEDEPLVRMGAVDLVVELGLSVLEAETAAAALDHLASGAPVGILFTDIDMPGPLNGLHLAARVAQARPAIRILVTSGHHLPAATDLPPGAVFLRKPYSVAEIHAVLSRFAAELGTA